MQIQISYFPSALTIESFQNVWIKPQSIRALLNFKASTSFNLKRGSIVICLWESYKGLHYNHSLNKFQAYNFASVLWNDE